MAKRKKEIKDSKKENSISDLINNRTSSTKNETNLRVEKVKQQRANNLPSNSASKGVSQSTKAPEPKPSIETRKQSNEEVEQSQSDTNKRDDYQLDKGLISGNSNNLNEMPSTDENDFDQNLSNNTTNNSKDNSDSAKDAAMSASVNEAQKNDENSDSTNNNSNDSQKNETNVDSESKKGNNGNSKSNSETAPQSKNSVDDFKTSNRDNKTTESNPETNKDENKSKLDALGDAAKAKLTGKLEESNLEKAAKKAQNTAKKAADVAKATSTLFSTLIAVITNPLTWIVIGIGLLIAVSSSGLQILGQSDFANNCSQSGTTSVGETLPTDRIEAGKTVASWLVNTPFETFGGKPMSSIQAAAMIGNMNTESGVQSTTVQTLSLSNPDYYKECDNDCVLSWGSVGGKAIGLIQWDSGRRVNLVNYAKEQGKNWWDATVQLEFLKIEIDGVEASSFKKAFVTCTDLNECTEDFRRDVERGGTGTTSERQTFAKQFHDAWDGKSSGAGSSTSSGSVASCSGSSSLDASGIVAAALSMAYPNSEYQKSNVGSDTSGKSNAKQEYLDGKAKAEAETGADPMQLWASCDRFVATVLRVTGADTEMPWGSTAEQATYMANSSKYERVGCGDRQPGDIIIVPGKHIMLYVGNVDGKDSLASASYLDRVAAVGGLQGCSGDTWLADGYTNAIGYRLK